MKRIVSVLASAVLLLLLTNAVLAAAATTYELDRFGITVELPSSCIAFTDDVKADDPNLRYYKLGDVNQLRAYMQGNDYCLFIPPADQNEWFGYLRIAETQEPAYNDRTEEALEMLIAPAEEEAGDDGLLELGGALLHHPQTTFVWDSCRAVEDGGVSLYYSTICNGYYLWFAVHGDQTLRPEQIHPIIESMYFEGLSFREEAVQPDPGAASESADAMQMPGDVRYADEKTGLAFTLSNAWERMPEMETEGYGDLVFRKTDGAQAVISYSSEDVYARAGEALGQTPRSKLDNSMFTTTQLAQLIGCEAQDISKRRYNAIEYFCIDTVYHEQAGNGGYDVPSMLRLRFENGYLYQFEWVGTDPVEGAADLTGLLERVEYPSGDGFSAVILLLDVLATVAIYSLPIAIYRYVIRKAPVEKKKATIITIIYGVCAFVLMSVILHVIDGTKAKSTVVIFWSYVNYAMLAKGKSAASTPTRAPAEASVLCQTAEIAKPVTAGAEAPELSVPAGAPEPDIRFCSFCGGRLPDDAIYCTYCGVKINRLQ